MRMIDFDTTAARLAATWDLADVRQTEVYDKENGRLYRVLFAGSGANCMVPFAEQYGYVSFRLQEFREVDGAADTDVLNIAAIGGLLASDSAPILLGDSAQSFAISWAASNVDPIAAMCDLPVDFDGSRDVTIMASTAGGTTNAGSLSINTYWDGGTVITDTVTGATSATVAAYTGTIAAADVPDAPSRLTLTIVPATHGTDAIVLSSFKLRYYRK